MKLRILDLNRIWFNGTNSQKMKERIDVIEQSTDSQFVFFHAVNASSVYWSAWSASPYWIFMRNNPRTNDSKYFHLVVDETANLNIGIVDGPEFDNLIINGVVAKDGEIIYSNSRYDHVTSQDGSETIDGGSNNFLHRSAIITRLYLDGAKLKVLDDLEFICGIEESPDQIFSPGSARYIFQQHVLSLLKYGMTLSEILISIQGRRKYQKGLLPVPWYDLTTFWLSELDETIKLKEVKSWLELNCNNQDYVWIGHIIYASDAAIPVQLKLRFG